MKRLLLTIWGLFLLKGNALAEQIPLMTTSQENSPLPPLKPIKVSEINANLFSAIYDFLKEAGANVFEGFVSLKDFVETGEWLIVSLQNPEMRDLVGSFGIRLTLSLFIAFAISQGVSSWLKPKIHMLLKCKEYSSPQKQQQLLSASLLSLGSPLAFGFSLYFIFRLISPNEGVYLEMVRILSSGSVTIWILLNVAHVFLKPASPDHQHIPISHEVLATTYGWLRYIGIVALLGFFALEMGALIHLPQAGEKLLLQGSGFIIALFAVLMILSLHEEVSRWIQKQQNYPQLSELKKAMLPYLQYSYIPVIIFIVISYVSWVTHEFDRFQGIVWKCLFTLALFPLLRVAAYWAHRLRILCIQRKIYGVSQPLAKHMIFYGQQIDVITIILLNVAALILVLDIWGFDPTYFIFSKLGRVIAEKAFSIFIIIVVALFITRMGNGLLTRYLNQEKEAVNEAEKQRAARFKTISSVSRNVLRIAVWVPAILFIIIEFEVIDVMPILATVGVLSFGLTFGIQSVIKDLATGFFMLLEDAFAVGDLVVINGQMGRIESLTVRVVRIRATDGSLFTFPYGNITSLSNQNRDFSAAVLLFQVGIESDINQVFDILEKISADLQKDKKTRPLLAGPIEIDGVNEISDHALEIRAILKTKPGQHYKVRWAFNGLLKQYLESAHIPAALPRHISYNYAFEK